ncbi:MAG: sigma-70 family RNA polymerase sigma factor [Melioribacteraceae bacterium]|nr:sigma-70 family RNA polymerase sigma factor [Melioribacteraceae bacterium]
MSLLNENNLINRCRMGESAAFGPLIKIYKQRLISYLIKLSGDRKAAEDLFQETLVKVWHGLPKYSEQNKFSSWLFSIAHNTAMDALRKNGKNEIFEQVEEPDNFVSATNPYQEMINAETLEMISNAVDKFPAKQKEVFLLRIHGGMTFKEIADITGESLNTVLSHMHYSVKKLRKILRFQNAE